LSLVFTPPLIALWLVLAPIRIEGDATGRQTSASLVGAVFFAIIVGAFVEAFHAQESVGVTRTIEKIMAKKFSRGDIVIANVSYPVYFSIPFLAESDLISNSVEGTFTLKESKNDDSCKYNTYNFSVASRSEGYVALVSGEQLLKISLCL
jgi:hypothetical protein